MNLPNLTGRSPTRRQEITFGGLNLADGARAGELRACDNVSARRYPVLSPRRGRRLVSDDGATSVFEWDGKLVKVVGTSLYYGSDLIGSVTPGEKQFAVVNTKLCIWPDKVYIDLKNMTLVNMAASYQPLAVADSVGFTQSSITARLYPKAATVTPDDAQIILSQVSEQDGYLYTYGIDKKSVSDCYVNGAWDTAALGTLEVLTGVMEAPNGSATKKTSVGDIVIPKLTDYALVVGTFNYSPYAETLPDKSEYNTDGYYAVITDIDKRDDPVDPGVNWYFFISYDVYKAGVNNSLFSGSFKIGDAVDISGSLYGAVDAEKVFIKNIDDGSNTMSFPDGSFFAPTACRELLQDFEPYTGQAGKAQFEYSGTYYDFTMPDGDRIGAGSVVCITDGSKVIVWSPSEKRVVKEYAVEQTGTTQTYRVISGNAYDTSGTSITVQKPVPSFDFICEHNNRLWGVSNNQENTIWNEDTKKFETFTSRCIYASALGEPDDFWTFEGLSTDSWQVAVGSEGDFTGLCAYDGVLAWKEQKLYRISGSYPAEYYLFDRDVEGVQKGSGKSLTVIDETLYYKGRDGVYAYRGGAPQLVSSVFGNHRYGSAVSGNDGQRLYISMKEDDTWGLYVYDTMTGLWTHEDGKQAAQFCRLDGKLLLLTDTGMLLELDHDGWKDPWQNPETGVWSETPVTWSAVFAPFDERDMHERKYYLRVLLRADVGEVGALLVYVDNDSSNQYKLVKALGQGVGTVVIPLLPCRIDEVKIALVGTGNASVLSLAREYTVGSIYGKEGVAP